jgi:hypothetical protein
MEQDDSIIKEGWLHKKSPSGFAGMHLWQKRYCVLTSKGLTYFKEKGKMETANTILVCNMVNTRYEPQKRKGNFV